MSLHYNFHYIPAATPGDAGRAVPRAMRVPPRYAEASAGVLTAASRMNVPPDARRMRPDQSPDRPSSRSDIPGGPALLCPAGASESMASNCALFRADRHPRHAATRAARARDTPPSLWRWPRGCALREAVSGEDKAGAASAVRDMPGDAVSGDQL